MANTNDNLKFLNLTQLGTLVEKIKGLISAAQTASTITAINFGEANGKNTLTITQGGNPITSNDIPFVSDSTNGFMSKDQYKAINTNITNLQTTAGSAVQMVGTSNGSKTSIYTPLKDVKVGDTTYTNVAVIQLVDSFDNLTDDDPKKTQAPTVNVVKNYTDAVNTALTDYMSANDTAVGKKLDTDTFNTFKTVDYTNFVNATNTALGTKANAADVYTKTELTGDGGLLTKKVDTTTFTAHTSAFDIFKEAVAGKNGDGTGGYLANKADKSTTYTKTEVNNAITALETKLLGGDRTEINDTYETLKGIAEWIENDEYGAAALATQVGTNKADIATLKTTVYGADGESGLQATVAQHTTNITNLSNDKADWGETLAEYGITNAYTKLETEAAIDAKVNPVKNLAESLRDTELPKKADKTTVLTSVTDFVLTDNNTKLTATFTKGDNTNPVLTINLITEDDINALFA